MKEYCLFILLLFVFNERPIAQAPMYDQDYFRVPINHKMKISGSFAELRPNHFHMGIDLKSSKGASGDPIVAAAEGYVSRIKVQSRGYGNTIYIDHPNGYTTVYAHLKEFHEDLAKYVKDIQYQRQEFEVDLYPEPGKFLFEKGEQIGLMGNSGRSFGPHLHFEIRETATEIPVNPFLFGIKPSDSKYPDLRKVIVYQMGPGGQLGERKDFPLIPSKKGMKKLKSDTISVPYESVGIGVEAYDYMDGASNRNGLYHLECNVDDHSVYSFTMNKLSFDEMRYLNAHIDYKERTKSKKYFQKCFIQEGNELSIYTNKGTKQQIHLDEHVPRKIALMGKDVEGNVTEVEFFIKKTRETKAFPSEVFNYFIKHDESNTISHNDIALNFPPSCIYEDTGIYISSSNSTDPMIVSQVYHIHKSSVPVHTAYEFRIDLSKLDTDLHDKTCVVSIDNGNYSSFGGEIEGNQLKANVRSFGSLGVLVDTTPPTIRPIAYKKDMKGRRMMSFKIKDNLTGIGNRLKYNGWIDDKWVLFEYDEKNDLIKHYFEKNLSPGKHSLRLEIIDGRNNMKTFVSEFIR